MSIVESNIKKGIMESKNYWTLIDSQNLDPCSEFIYFTETLYRAPSGEYIMHTMWLISPEWARIPIENGEISAKELEPHEVYKIISDEQAQKWLEENVQPKKRNQKSIYKIKGEF